MFRLTEKIKFHFGLNYYWCVLICRLESMVLRFLYIKLSVSYHFSDRFFIIRKQVLWSFEFLFSLKTCRLKEITILFYAHIQKVSFFTSSSVIKEGMLFRNLKTFYLYDIITEQSDETIVVCIDSTLDRWEDYKMRSNPQTSTQI